MSVHCRCCQRNVRHDSAFARGASEEKRRVAGYLPLWIVGVLYYGILLQTFTTMTIFVTDRVDLEMFGWQLPATWLIASDATGWCGFYTTHYANVGTPGCARAECDPKIRNRIGHGVERVRTPDLQRADPG
ncbi:hypothetical protein H5400_24615 [Rhodococcus wratislaviensis]|nr:hypothetical protein [Rhodococcus sp. 3A]MBC2893257.1 hypothetical protein [Rhodococcus sp. 4CII]